MFTKEHLHFAWLQVRAGSKTAGIDGISVDLFESMATEQLQKLEYQLHHETYTASPAKGFYIPKKNGSKRLIGICTVRDRIIQRLLLDELYFPLEDTFLDCSYAYRPGHSIHQAVQHLYGYYQYQPKWIIKADIADFFDNLCWALLLTVLEELSLEPSLMQLLQGQLKSGIIVAGQYRNFGKGVLQGGILSGALANLYLTNFDRKCLSQGIEKRTKRPPTDPVNSLLSLGYTLLSQNVFSFVQVIGLHTHFGNLHVPRDNHPALVSDLMEEFRAQLVDSLVAYLINSKIFTSEDFTSPDEKGGVYLQPHALKKFLKHWEEKLQSELTHPHTGYQVSLRRCLELQVREYIACLTGQVELYRPMIWKL